MGHGIQRNPSFSLDLVADHAQRSGVNRQALGIVSENSRLGSPYVLCGDDGEPYRTGKIRSAFERATKKAKVKDLRFHDLRHDFASCLAQAGVDLNLIRELMGHKDLRTTIRYAHLRPEHLREAVDTLEGLERSRFVHVEKKGASSE